jgi:hypothetical protein
MTSQEFLQENKDLLISAIKTKISRTEQKNRWNEKNGYVPEITAYRKEKIKKYAIALEWLQSKSID